jgi:NAD(P)-dependent dehydrogenase (short-subunit alcohol dehydrogenase family)
VLLSPGVSLYASAKSAIITFARYAAREEGKNGIRINCVLPGYCVTPMMSGGSEDAKV